MAITDTLTRPARTPVEPAAEPTTATDRPIARRLPRWLANGRLGMRLGTFAAGSVVSTLVSQVTLTGLYWWGGASATTAAVLAFVAGAIPNFLMNWYWTWGRSGRPALVRELVPYLAISIGGGLAATTLTTLAHRWVVPLIADRGGQTVVLDLAYLGSYGLLFLVKFALLDRLLGNRRGAAAAEAPRVPVDAG